MSRGTARTPVARGAVVVVAALMTMTSAIVPIALSAAPAAADPLADKLDQASRIQDQLDSFARELTALSQQYDQAQLEYEQATQAVDLAVGRLVAATGESERVQRLLDERAAFVYRRTVAGKSLDGFDLNDGDHVVSRRQYAAAQSAREDDLLAHLEEQKQVIREETETSQLAQAAVNTHRREIEAAREAIEAQTSEEQALLQQLQGEILPLVLAEQQRRLVSNLALAQGRYAPGSLGDGNPDLYPNIPPPTIAATVAIYYALTQLGKPYLYAAAGPDSFDCSGLVMAAYAAAGIALPHYSGAQYAQLPAVPLDAMLPGDLVFWGPDASKHVAIYVGAGRIIEAGGTGHNVHIGPIWGQPFGAARPS